ncbi:Cytochrome P450 71A4 [Glycine max]|nr:Cytochrome P450 71A4 [Glycine max]
MLLHFGKVPVHVVSSSDAAREVMKTHDLVFSDRPQRKINDILLQLRSLSVLHLLSTKRVQSFRGVREEKTARMMENIWQCCCDSLHVNLSDLCAALANDSGSGKEILWGRREGVQHWLLEFRELLVAVSVGEDYVLWLDWMSKVNGLSQRAHGVAKNLDQFIDEVISDHVRNGRDGHVDVDSEEQNDFVNDMLVAGTDTTYTTLEWTISELLKHPKGIINIITPKEVPANLVKFIAYHTSYEL